MNIITYKYETACKELATSFLGKYYPEDKLEDIDVYFVADDVTGILFIGDMFYSIDDMYQYIKYDYSYDELYDRYHESLNALTEKKTFYNIKNWKLSK